MEVIQLFLLGSIVGIVSSFFGIGGGSIIVPILYTLYPQLPASVVIPISLGSIFIVALNNVNQFRQQKLLPSKDIIITLLIACTLGAVLGSEILYLIDTSLAKSSMGYILLIMIFNLLFLNRNKKKSTHQTSKKIIPYAILGFLGSLVSSITGLGGGIVFTPLFLSVLKVSAKRVSSYSNLAMLVATLFGVLPHFFTKTETIYFSNKWFQNSFIGNVNLMFIIIIAIGGFISSKLGMYLNSIVSENIKKFLLASILAVFSFKLLM